MTIKGCIDTRFIGSHAGRKFLSIIICLMCRKKQHRHNAQAPLQPLILVICNTLQIRLRSTVPDCNKTVPKYSKFSPIKNYSRMMPNEILKYFETVLLQSETL